MAFFFTLRNISSLMSDYTIFCHISFLQVGNKERGRLWWRLTGTCIQTRMTNLHNVHVKYNIHPSAYSKNGEITHRRGCIVTSASSWALWVCSLRWNASGDATKIWCTVANSWLLHTTLHIRSTLRIYLTVLAIRINREKDKASLTLHKWRCRLILSIRT